MEPEFFPSFFHMPMFLPENQKKLTNVSVVSLKKFGRRYEVAVYPNKLYEYQNRITSSISEIVHTDQIFTNVSKGEVCPEQYLKPFQKTRHEIIKEILERGTEQKDTRTRNFELKKTENEIIHFLQGKILNKGKYMSVDNIKKLISGFKIEIGSSKIQAQDIAKKLVEMGYEKVKMMIEIRDEDKIPKIVDAFECQKVKSNVLKISSDSYQRFQAFCSQNSIRFHILQSEEISEEDVC